MIKGKLFPEPASTFDLFYFFIMTNKTHKSGQRALDPFFKEIIRQLNVVMFTEQLELSGADGIKSDLHICHLRSFTS